MPYRRVKPIRPTLSDKAHINLLNLGIFLFLSFTPSSVTEFYKMGKLIGYYSTNQALKTLNLDRLILSLSRKGLFWKVFENKKIQETQRIGWLKSGEVILELVEITREKQELVYTMKDFPSSVFQEVNKPVCFLPVGILAGQAEALFGTLWDGVETRCQCMGDPECEIRLYAHEEEIEPETAVLGKTELNAIVDQILSDTVCRRKGLRESSDVSHISPNQCLNYLLISLSRGHEILLKYSGKTFGERLLSETELDGVKPALEYCKDLFLYLKAGILHDPEKQGDRYFVRMDESVYASGVNNIDMKLCVFLAGVIEGILNKATDEKWDVTEKHCIAAGGRECVFLAQQRE